MRHPVGRLSVHAAALAAGLALLALVPASAEAFAGDGSGTLSISPAYVIGGSTGTEFTFTYTAASGGISDGEVDVTVPAGWSTPQTGNSSGAGWTITHCGQVAVTGNT